MRANRAERACLMASRGTHNAMCHAPAVEERRENDKDRPENEVVCDLKVHEGPRHRTAPVAMMDSDVANVLSRLSAYLCERLRVAVSEL